MYRLHRLVTQVRWAYDSCQGARLNEPLLYTHPCERHLPILIFIGAGGGMPMLELLPSEKLPRTRAPTTPVAARCGYPAALFILRSFP
jgi:hypothetical protein